MRSKAKSNADSANAKVFNIPVIRCRCGTEILLMPNAQTTGQAIEQHIQNCNLVKQSTDRNKCIDDLNDYLIMQVIDKASEAQPEEKHSVNTHPA